MKEKDKENGPIVIIKNISSRLHIPCDSFVSHNCKRNATIKYTIIGFDPIYSCDTDGCVRRAKKTILVIKIKKRYAQ